MLARLPEGILPNMVAHCGSIPIVGTPVDQQFYPESTKGLRERKGHIVGYPWVKVQYCSIWFQK